ncbi:MAG TPA: deoxynucleoside kinase [Kofleriaceae bacterium]|nr:deoxynucleoside kinase [Kofleriaceae bacterium]
MSEQRRYVAVDGPPGSGASAVARAIALATGAELIPDPAPANPFRDDFARSPERFAFQTQTFCLLARYRQQIELAQPDLFSTSGAVTDYVFARDALFARVTLRPDELHLYQRIHQLLDQRLPRPDLVVYVTAARDVLRARLRGLVASSDRVIKLSVVERLAGEMDEHFCTYDQAPLLILDTTAVEQPLGAPGGTAQLAAAVEAVRRTRGGARCVRLGAL